MDYDLFSAAFGKEIAKIFIVSAAAMAGTVGGIIAIGAAVEIVDKIKSKKTQKTPVTQ